MSFTQTENQNEPNTDIKPAAKEIKVEWPPNNKTRYYYSVNADLFDPKTKGKQLPAYQQVLQYNQAEDEQQAGMLHSVKLYTDLPKPFYQAFLLNQTTEYALALSKYPKSLKVRDSFDCSWAFRAGPLRLDLWQELGWDSKSSYEAWLDTPLLFAFSQSMHYCSALRVFELDEEETTAEHAIFQEIDLEKGYGRTTNILSLAGMDFSHFLIGARDKKTKQKISPDTLNSGIWRAIVDNTYFQFRHLLTVAEKQQVTDVVLIPVGRGVFMQSFTDKDKEKALAQMDKGMISALNAYNGPPVTLHCCIPEAMWASIQQIKNPRIQLIYRGGEDAYVVANNIQDLSDRNAELEVIPEALFTHYEPRRKKSLLINAGNHDWLCLLDPTKLPGQHFLGHTLYNSVADEYYALMTLLPFYAINRLINCNLLDSFSLYTFNKLSLVHNQDDLEKEASPPEIGVVKDADFEASALNVETNSHFPASPGTIVALSLGVGVLGAAVALGLSFGVGVALGSSMLTIVIVAVTTAPTAFLLTSGLTAFGLFKNTNYVPLDEKPSDLIAPPDPTKSNQ